MKIFHAHSPLSPNRLAQKRFPKTYLYNRGRIRARPLQTSPPMELIGLNPGLRANLVAFSITFLSFSSLFAADLRCQFQFSTKQVITLESADLIELNPENRQRAEEQVAKLRPLIDLLHKPFAYELFLRTLSTNPELNAQLERLQSPDPDLTLARGVGSKMLELMISEFLPESEIIEGKVPLQRIRRKDLNQLTLTEPYQGSADSKELLGKIRGEYKELLERLSNNYQIKTRTGLFNGQAVNRVRNAIAPLAEDESLMMIAGEMVASVIPYLAVRKKILTEMEGARAEKHEEVKGYLENAKWWFKNAMTFYAGTMAVMGFGLGALSSGGTVNGGVVLGLMLTTFFGPTLVGLTNQMIYDHSINKAIAPYRRDLKALDGDPTHKMLLEMEVEQAQLTIELYESNKRALMLEATLRPIPEAVSTLPQNLRDSDNAIVQELVNELNRNYLLLVNIGATINSIRQRHFEAINRKSPDENQDLAFEKISEDASKIDEDSLNQLKSDSLQIKTKLDELTMLVEKLIAQQSESSDFLRDHFLADLKEVKRQVNQVFAGLINSIDQQTPLAQLPHIEFEL